MVETLLATLILFAEPGFPAIDVPTPLIELPGAAIAVSVEELTAALTPGRVLVWRHGSTFPADAWPAFVRFLEAGGSFVFLGGEPFTRPVTGTAGARVVAPRTVALLGELRLNQCSRLALGTGGALRYREVRGRTIPDCALDDAAWVSVLQPRLSDTKDFAHEDGAPGARDGVVRPLSFVHRAGDDPRFPAAAASFVIDRLRGRFAGGRWVLRLLSTPPSLPEIELLVAEAARPVVEVRVDPTFGCFHEGEAPSVIVRVDRPGVAATSELHVTLQIEGPLGTGVRRWDSTPVELRGGEHASLRVRLDMPAPEPGLYRVSARAPDEDPVTTGFWIFDPQLFASGDDLSCDATTLLRNGVPEPVMGTTVMSRTVHRKFLFEPNAAVWDETFAELAALGINLVRTGVWSGYRKIALDPGVIDEGFLRALEAYYLTARRHRIPVLFTFFSFVPEAFGGENPYFDPRAIEGQKAYVAAVATRFRSAKEMLWDLINEPSFSSPDKLWLCRPHGDPHEEAAFRAWLAERYADAGGGDWETTVRARWRLRPDEAIGLPKEDDFSDRQVFAEHRPYRAREYVRFAQEAFRDWAETLVAVLRTADADALVTVGQDEGGLLDRPSPLHHERVVDFTSIHTWWFNDALLWDGVLAKVEGKPLLASETGIMQRQELSGEAIRSDDDNARLLARKIGNAFAARAFGVVQWCYDVNPYMASDNEVAIGLRRADGSYKPEHAVVRRFAAFLREHGRHLSGLRPPEVVLLLPSADHYSPRGLQLEGTQRAVSLLAEELGHGVRVVAEDCVLDQLGTPRLIVLPACRGIAEEAWDPLVSAVEAGAVLLCSGWFETDDAGLPARRLGVARRPLATVETHELESGEVLQLRFERRVTESAFAAAGERGLAVVPRGQGVILHSPVPLEWAPVGAWQRQAYATAMQRAGVRARLAGGVTGVTIQTLEYEHATLLVAINESSCGRVVPLPGFFESTGEPAASLQVPAGEARWVLFDAGRRQLGRSHPE
ncbi:MAG: hypothetical protein AB7O52_11650 [Planctomycetota bacterium]